jgi:hypothetical protein
MMDKYTRAACKVAGIDPEPEAIESYSTGEIGAIAAMLREEFPEPLPLDISDDTIGELITIGAGDEAGAYSHHLAVKTMRTALNKILALRVEDHIPEAGNMAAKDARELAHEYAAKIISWTKGNTLRTSEIADLLQGFAARLAAALQRERDEASINVQGQLFNAQEIFDMYTEASSARYEAIERAENAEGEAKALRKAMEQISSMDGQMCETNSVGIKATRIARAALQSQGGGA